MMEISVPSRPGQSRPSCFLGADSADRRVRNRKLKRARARDRAIDRERAEIGFADERISQQLVILPARDFSRAEYFQVVGHELGVKQPEAAGL